MIQYDVKKFIEDSLVTPLLISSPLLYVPLFHGTDQSILNMTDEERAYARNSCLTIIPRLLSAYLENNFINNLSRFRNFVDLQSFQKISNAYTRANGLHNNSAYYEYDHTYLTNDLDRAYDYAKNATVFGELGYTTYYLYKGIQKFRFTPPELSSSEQLALEFIKKSSQKVAQPVVLMFLGLEKTLLSSERGNEANYSDLIDSFINNQYYAVSLQYLGKLDFNKGIPIDIRQIPIKK